MSYIYLKVDIKNSDRVKDLFKNNQIDFDLTKASSDFLFEEDAKKALDEYLMKENIDIYEDEYKDIIDYIAFYLYDFDWCEYDSYIDSLIKSYFEQKS